MLFLRHTKDVKEGPCSNPVMWQTLKEGSKTDAAQTVCSGLDTKEVQFNKLVTRGN